MSKSPSSRRYMAKQAYNRAIDALPSQIELDRRDSKIESAIFKLEPLKSSWPSDDKPSYGSAPIGRHAFGQGHLNLDGQLKRSKRWKSTIKHKYHRKLKKSEI